MREIIKVSIASSIGIAFEFYDFLIFGFVASNLAQLFFPSQNQVASLLYTLAVFATGFAGRPLGAVLFGHLGDRIGRKYTLVFTITLMGLSSLFTALLPTYQEWGVLASILLAVLRFLQGVSLGGEFGGGIVLTAEFAEANRRAFWVAIAQTAQGTGPLLANGLIALLLVLLTPTQYALIGWRILFGIGALIAVIGVIIRLKIAESPIFSNIKNKGEITRIPIAEAFSKYWKRILIGLGFIVGGTTITYATGVFASSYLQTFIHVPPLQVSLALVIGYTAIAIFSPIFGMLSDKIGRKPFMITSAVLLIAFVYPYFILISTGQFSLIALAQFIIGLIGSIYNGPYAATMSEMFPTRVRYSALSFDYHVGVAVFGGTTPFIATYLIYVTHYQLSPALYGIAGMVVTLIAYVLAPETKGTNLDKVVI